MRIRGSHTSRSTGALVLPALALGHRAVSAQSPESDETPESAVQIPAGKTYGFPDIPDRIDLDRNALTGNTRTLFTRLQWIY